MIDKLKVGEISAAFATSDQRNRDGYRIVMLKKRTEPHRANLEQDYQKIKNVALQQKEQGEVEKWIDEKLENAYVKMDEKYSDCEFSNKWVEETPQ